MFDEDDDQGQQLFGTGTVRNLEREVGLAMPPIIQRELAVMEASAVTVETPGQVRDRLSQKSAEVGRVVQGLADHAIRQIAWRWIV
jgi:hypothetical protein